MPKPAPTKDEIKAAAFANGRAQQQAALCAALSLPAPELPPLLRNPGLRSAQSREAEWDLITAAQQAGRDHALSEAREALGLPALLATLKQEIVDATTEKLWALEATFERRLDALTSELEHVRRGTEP